GPERGVRRGRVRRSSPGRGPELSRTGEGRVRVAFSFVSVMSERGRGGGEGVRTRDHLANLRTTLTWIRTGMILMAAGYTTDKLGVLDRLHQVPSGLSAYGHWLGVAAVGAGVVVTAAALPRCLVARNRIESPRFEPRPWADLALMLGLGVAGLALLV